MAAGVVEIAEPFLRTRSLRDLRVKLYADGADRSGILALAANPLICGITTNPTLLRKAGVTDYPAFARDVLRDVKEKPVSFEICTDLWTDAVRQARTIASWGENVFVKIPIVNSLGESAEAVLRELSHSGVRVNVTAVTTTEQVRRIARALCPFTPAVVSVFAGRIADAGMDPKPVMTSVRALLRGLPKTQVLWASVREVWNIFEADESGCDIVTVPHDILNKALRTVGAELETVTLETVRMFAGDITAAGYSI